METATEEAAAVTPCLNVVTPCLNTDVIAKGKRTKRQRPNSPFSFTITRSPRAAAAASSEESTTTEEADTARCLILLSQGHFIPATKNRHIGDAGGCATTSGAAAGGGACMYTCKTCNRSFQSFQALGGHRASHKKPKNEKRYAIFSDEEDFNKFSPTSLSLQLSSVSTTAAAMKSPRVHECSYCGAEFASGQALGGHMRKHRGGAAAAPIPSNIREAIVVDEAEAEERKKGGNWLSLDLNLPAPDDERERSPNRIGQPLLLNR